MYGFTLPIAAVLVHNLVAALLLVVPWLLQTLWFGNVNRVSTWWRTMYYKEVIMVTRTSTQHGVVVQGAALSQDLASQEDNSQRTK